MKKVSFKDGWSNALKEVSITTDSDLFLRHHPSTPPNIEEEVDDEEGIGETSPVPVVETEIIPPEVA